MRSFRDAETGQKDKRRKGEKARRNYGVGAELGTCEATPGTLNRSTFFVSGSHSGAGEDCLPPPPGLAKFSFASAYGIGASFGVVAEVAFEALPTALEGQSTQVTFSVARFYDSVPEPFEVTTAPGTVHFRHELAIGAGTNKCSIAPGRQSASLRSRSIPSRAQGRRTSISRWSSPIGR